MMNINPLEPNIHNGGIKAGVKAKLKSGAKKVKAALLELGDCYIAGVNPYAAEERIMRKAAENRPKPH